jgi:glutaredoxin
MRSGWLALLPFFYASLAAAQFKWVDGQGRIGYGDKPPADAHHVERLEGYVKGAPPDPMAGLPFELRQTLKSYPVTLYTMSNCPGCDSGRAYLKSRGIPFTERTIERADDVKALNQAAGTGQLPAFKVGSQALTGFNSARWDEALNLAGYPNESQLPPDWKWPPPKPLVEPPPAPADATAAAAAEPAPQAPAERTTPAPAGANR